jgi:hypothetical protein
MAADQALAAGMKAAGASDQAVNSVRLASVAIGYILYRRSLKRAAANPSEPQPASVPHEERPADPSRPYSHIQDSPSVGPRKKFTSKQKAKIYEENMANNGGEMRSDLDGEPLVMPSKSKKGVTPPANEAQVDHIVPLNPADPNVAAGTNSFGNAQVLSRQQNRAKSNN